MDHDIEKLNLTKQQVIDIIDKRVVEWKKNWRDNKVYILEAYAVKMLIKSAPEKKFGGFWEVLIKDIDAVRYENVKQELPQVFKLAGDTTNKYSLDFTRAIK